MTATFDAFYLPGDYPEDRVETGGPRFRTLQARGLECRYPTALRPLLEAVLTGLEEAGSDLRQRPIEDLLGIIDAAAARLADPADELRQEADALLPVATGYSRPMIRLILDRMTADWRAPALRRLLELELGDATALDGFVARGDRDAVMALGPRLAFHVFSGNVPGVAVTSLIRALLLKAPSLGKLAAGEPVLPVLFARAVASVDQAVGKAIAVTYWPGGEEEAERLAVRTADAVVVYGGEEAVASIAQWARPGQRLLAHGPKISFAAVGEGPLEGGLEGVAERAALAVATFDQQGCVSPHAIWVEGSQDRAEAFAELLAAALERLASDLPRATLSAAEASAIHQERGTAEMRAHADPRVRVWAGEGTAWTVVLEPGDSARGSCLNRFVRIHPVDDLEALPARLQPLRSRLQSFALEGAGARSEELARELGRAGATRITDFERLPWPSPHSPHDGALPLGELLRWTGREQ